MTASKNRNNPGFFDTELRLDQLTTFGDPLQRIKSSIDWELFRPILDRAFAIEAKGPGGRPRYDLVLMFKILILQQLYNLSDAQAQFQILDRRSFARFLDLLDCDAVPDEKTIWLFREKLNTTGTLRPLFKAFIARLKQEGLLVKSGSLIDATIVEVPIQRNTKSENAQLKAGNIPQQWEEHPRKLQQKDRDARWTKKNTRSFFGYKNHTKVDRATKLITEFEVSPAEVHDSLLLPLLVNEEDAGTEVFADRAYDSEQIRRDLAQMGVEERICRRRKPGRGFWWGEKKRNGILSRIRCRVEHVFGTQTTSMHAGVIRTKGLVRAETVIGLRNLAYDMMRCGFLRQASVSMVT